MVVRHGYQPIRPPEKQLTQEDMWKTLAKHAHAEVRILRENAAQSPKEKPAVALRPLKWQKPVRTGELSGYVLSQCGRYSISRDSVKGAVMYTAWKRSPPDADGRYQLPKANLGVRLTRKEAEHLCELEAGRE